jgi:hypothetical protein
MFSRSGGRNFTNWAGRGQGARSAVPGASASDCRSSPVRCRERSRDTRSGFESGSVGNRFEGQQPPRGRDCRGHEQGRQPAGPEQGRLRASDSWPRSEEHPLAATARDGRSRSGRADSVLVPQGCTPVLADPSEGHNRRARDRLTVHQVENPCVPSIALRSTAPARLRP